MKSTFAVVLLTLLLVGCNGGGTRVIPPPPPPQPGPPMLTITAPLANAALSGMTNISASLQNVPNALGVRFEVDGAIIGVEDTIAPYGVSWDTRSVANGAHSLQAIARLASGETLRSTMVNVTVQNTVAPTVMFPQTTITVALGATVTIHASVTGDPAPTQLTCTPPSFGSVSVQGFDATYVAATARPALFATSFTCSVQTSAGNASVTVTVNLLNPQPTESSVALDGAFSLVREGSIIGLTVVGSGFVSGGTMHTTCGVLQGFTIASFTQLQVNFTYDPAQWNPGFCTLTYVSPTNEPGGGTLNVTLAFLGNFNALSCAPNECYFLDQGAKRIRAFDFAGNELRSFASGYAGVTYAIAHDATTGFVAESNTSGHISVFRGVDGVLTGDLFNGKATLHMDALNGILGVVQHQDDRVSFADMRQLGNGTTSVPLEFVGISGQPWLIKLFARNNELFALVFSRQTTTLTLVNVSTKQIVQSLPLPNLLAGGHWQLVVLGNVAALLSQQEKKLIFVDTMAMQELRRVSLDGVPFRLLAQQNAVIVLKADRANRRSIMELVSVSDGSVSALANTFSLLGVGFAPCASQACGAQGSTLQQKPLQ